MVEPTVTGEVSTPKLVADFLDVLADSPPAEGVGCSGRSTRGCRCATASCSWTTRLAAHRGQDFGGYTDG